MTSGVRLASMIAAAGFALYGCTPVTSPEEGSLDVTLTGRLVDPWTSSPIDGAQVSLSGIAYSVTTDSAGRFTIAAELPSGLAILRVRRVGYSAVEQTINVRIDGEQSLGDLTMSSAVIACHEVIVVMDEATAAEPLESARATGRSAPADAPSFVRTVKASRAATTTSPTYR